MNNFTKMRVERSSKEVFEAIVDPAKIGNFWFSSSSERWEAGKTVTLTYDEYKAQVDILVMEVVMNRTIKFQWGANGEGHTVTIVLKAIDDSSTLIEVNEEGFEESQDEFIHQLVDNKEGWVFMLTCLKAYLERDICTLRVGLVK